MGPLSCRLLIARQLWLAAAAFGAVVGPASLAVAADSGEVRITAIAPADCRLVRSPLEAAVSTRLACNTPRPALVTLSLAGPGARVPLIDGKPIATGPGPRAIVPAEALARLADWRLQGDAGGATVGGTVELIIVAD